MPIGVTRTHAALRQNAIAVLALFAALGGTSYAASSALTRGSVKAAQIANDAISSSKVKDGSLMRVDLAPGVLGGGAPGAAGAAGARGPSGEDGRAGTEGADGVAGLSVGAAGSSGPTGPIGPKGTTGPAGVRGPVGDAGPAGDPAPSPPGFAAAMTNNTSKTLAELPDVKLIAFCGAGGFQIVLERKTRFSFDGEATVGDGGSVLDPADDVSTVVGAARGPGDPGDTVYLVATGAADRRAHASATIWTPSGVYGLDIGVRGRNGNCTISGLVHQTLG